MPAGTRTFGIDQTFMESQVLPPPPTRHALLVFLIALASILHIGTAGWSDIHNGAEGHYASSAREMLRTGSWTTNEPPLVPWLLAGSFKIFGVHAAAARLPIAAAMVASVALTFLVGERLAGYWRGFVAGLVHLCCLGSFVWGRLVTPEPIFAALTGAAIFCGICGYQGKQTRRLWFGAVWIFAALACHTRGLPGLLFPAAIFLALGAGQREARLRFRELLHWRLLLLFALLMLPWLTWMPPQFDAGFIAGSASTAERMPLARLLLSTAVWSFPALLLSLPGLLFATRRVLRPHEFGLGDALPLCWVVAGFLPVLFLPGAQDYHSMIMWSAGALIVACIWDRTPGELRVVGIASVALAVVAVAAAILAGKVPILSSAAWPTMNPAVALTALAFVLACVAAGYFTRRNREDFAITAVMLAMVPIGLMAAEGMARHGAQFSLAPAGEFLQPLVGETGAVLYEGTPHSGSSLTFYLNQPPIFVRSPGVPTDGFQAIEREAAMEKMRTPEAVYLIVRRDQIAFWQKELTQRFHIYHQVTTCGPHVVIKNHP